MKRVMRAMMTACAIGTGILGTAAYAADDPRDLQKQIDSLKKQIEELSAKVKAATGEQGGTPPAVAQPAAPAAAPRSGTTVKVLGGELTIYGTLNADVGTVKREGATAGSAALNSLVGAPGAAPTNVPQRYTLRSNSSNIGFRGERRIVGDLKAVFQLESALGLDGNSSTLLGRDTYLGLAGGFGALLYGGNIDSPYKRGVQGKDPFYATGIASHKGILGSPGFNVTSVNAVAGTTVGGNAATAQQQNAGFDARLNNLVMYRSPVFRGLSAELGYGLNEQKSTSVGNQINPGVQSYLLRYEAGGIYASYAYERRKDVFGLNSLLTLVPGSGVTGALFSPPAGASSRDVGNKLGLGYNFGLGEVFFAWERLRYQTSVGAVSEYERDAWVASAFRRFGPHRAIASYGRAQPGSCSLASGAGCSTSGLGARQISLGYDYQLADDTVLYAFWSRIRNEAAAAYNFGVSGAPAAGVGADPQALALGIRYRF